MSTEKKLSKVDQHKLIVDAGRKSLRDWLKAAEKHGTIYYVIESVSRSGMSRNISLATIVMSKGKPVLSKLWPRLDDKMWSHAQWSEYNAALDVVASDWGFSFKVRSFKVGGCGMDMVFSQIDYLAQIAGVNRSPNEDSSKTKDQGHRMYANRVKRESF